MAQEKEKEGQTAKSARDRGTITMKNRTHRFHVGGACRVGRIRCVRRTAVEACDRLWVVAEGQGPVRCSTGGHHGARQDTKTDR